MKERWFKNIKTTGIGVIILLLGCFMILSKVMFTVGEWNNGEFSIREILTVFFISWVFISAKDSLLEGILLGFIKKQ